MNPPKPSTARVAALRARREKLGLKRLELYAHPGDWPAIKAAAKELQRLRELREMAQTALTPNVF